MVAKRKPPLPPPNLMARVRVASLGNNYCYILKGFAITSLIHSAPDYFVELHLREDGIEVCAKKYGGEEGDFN